MSGLTPLMPFLRKTSYKGHHHRKRTHMAMARCLAHKPTGITFTYDGPPKKPFGDGAAIICAKCFEVGMIWLNEYEESRYLGGERYFSLQSNENGRIRVS